MECLIDSDSVGYYFDIIEAKSTTSLKAEVCCECGDTITPGTVFNRVVGMQDHDNSEEEIYTTCMICHGLRRFLCQICYGCLYDDIAYALAEYDNSAEIENKILTDITYTELQWLMRFDVLDLDNDMDNDEE